MPDDDGTDDDQDAGKGAQRRCVVTREVGERARMLRFVVGPDNAIVPDLAARLPGRGIWLSARADVIHSPRLRQAFARAARAQVAVPDDLAAIIGAGLQRRIADLIGFARRAGQAVSGYQKAHEWLVANKAALIIQAHDGSRDERDRFLGVNVAMGRAGGGTGIPVLTPLSAARLGGVFGRDEAVHVAVSPGRLAEALLIEAERLAGVLPVQAEQDQTTGGTDEGAARDNRAAVMAATRHRDADV